MRRALASIYRLLLLSIALIQIFSVEVRASSESDQEKTFSTECQFRALQVTWELYPEKIPQQAQTRKEVEHNCNLLIPYINEKKKWSEGALKLGCWYGIQTVIDDKPMDERKILTQKLMKAHCN